MAAIASMRDVTFFLGAAQVSPGAIAQTDDLTRRRIDRLRACETMTSAAPCESPRGCRRQARMAAPAGQTKLPEMWPVFHNPQSVQFCTVFASATGFTCGEDSCSQHRRNGRRA